ncbi:helix-turn-helix domain-containing protein [Psychrobacillus sp. FSL K6-1464]|uniref:helix-turn-helix domain-containing protein n=1 Tax=Psychrobacillus sp. FSL K6-1464 TaxID=2921545 RepID=UPI0030FAF9AC
MFGKNLAKLRKVKKLSQYDLAERTGLSRGQIANYEQGTRQPDFETLLNFADFFGVSTDYLLTGEQSGQIMMFENDIGTFEDPFNVRFPIRLKQTMENKDMTVTRLTEILDLKESEIEGFLNVPTVAVIPYDLDKIKKIALILDVPLNYLIGDENKVSSQVKKEERDIAKRLEAFKEEIENSDGLAFDGEPMSDEAKESLTEAMEHLFRQTKRINKKYIPNKFKE